MNNSHNINIPQFANKYTYDQVDAYISRIYLRLFTSATKECLGNKQSRFELLKDIESAFFAAVDDQSSPCWGILTNKHFAWFTHMLFRSSPVLNNMSLVRWEFITRAYSQYLRGIPVRGAIIFNSSMTHVLTITCASVPGLYPPRGKRDEGEDDVTTAIREINEEVGLDIKDYIVPNEFMHVQSNRDIKFFLVVSPLSGRERFPLTQSGEATSIQWTPLESVDIWGDSSSRFMYSVMTSLMTWLESHIATPSLNQRALEKIRFKLAHEHNRTVSVYELLRVHIFGAYGRLTYSSQRVPPVSKRDLSHYQLSHDPTYHYEPVRDSPSDSDNSHDESEPAALPSSHKEKSTPAEKRYKKRAAKAAEIDVNSLFDDENVDDNKSSKSDGCEDLSLDDLFSDDASPQSTVVATATAETALVQQPKPQQSTTPLMVASTPMSMPASLITQYPSQISSPASSTLSAVVSPATTAGNVAATTTTSSTPLSTNSAVKSKIQLLKEKRYNNPANATPQPNTLNIVSQFQRPIVPVSSVLQPI